MWVGAEQASDPLSAMMAPRVYSFSAFQSSSNLPSHAAGSNPPPSFSMWVPPPGTQKSALPATAETDDVSQESIASTEVSQAMWEALPSSISPLTVPPTYDSGDNHLQSIISNDGIGEQRIQTPPQDTLYANSFSSSQGNFIEDF